jgi:putative tryptophan/tyrosine transport system substrate-binding protein
LVALLDFRQPSSIEVPMRLIGLAVILAFSLILVPLAAEAQPPKVARLGYLVTGSLESPEVRARRDAFRTGLRELGYVEGQNIVIEYRGAEGKIERLRGLATELTRLKVDLIMAVATPAARAAQQATSAIPIVATAMGDPVRDGLVASLARPGGNVTGTTFLGPELVPKRLELLKQALPRVSRVAGLWHPGAFSEGTMRDMLKETEAAARTLGVQLQLVAVRGPDEFDRAFSTMISERAEALLVFPSTMLFAEGKRIVDLAAKHRLPSMFNAREFVDLGGLIAYGASLSDLNRRAATYVDKILKGAKPADLPVEQPTKFELVVNLKTAKALGLTIPQSLVLRADEVIQ